MEYNNGAPDIEWSPGELVVGTPMIQEYKNKRGRRGTDLGLLLQRPDERVPSKEEFEGMMAMGNPPCCSLIVRGMSGTETILLEGVEWGKLVVAMEKATARTGKVTGVAANQSLKRIYLIGPGLPETGMPLRLPKLGFSEQLYTLEDTLRKTGVPFNFGLTCQPDIDNLQVMELIKMREPLVNLPMCHLDTETIVSYVRKYAEAKAVVTYLALKSYVEQLKVDGIGISGDGNSWYTLDGRKGLIPWIAKENVRPFEPPPPLKVGGSTLSPRSAPRSATTTSHLAPSVRSRSPRSPASSLLKSPRTTGGGLTPRSRSRSHSNSRAGRSQPWRPSGGRVPSVAPSDTYTASSSHRSKRVTTQHHHVEDLINKQTYVVGPSILHIPAGMVVSVDPEYGLKPLRVVMHEGGKILSSECPIPLSDPDFPVDKPTYLDL